MNASDPTTTVDPAATGGHVDPTTDAAGGQPATTGAGGTIGPTGAGGIPELVSAGGAGGGAGGTWSESWTTVAFTNGRAAPNGKTTQPPNGYGWVSPAPATTLLLPRCDGAPITASTPCSHTPDWPTARELCISGSIPADVKPDDGSRGVMVGLNVTEPSGGALGVAYVRTFITLSGSPATGLRLVVHRSGDPEGTTYCVPVTTLARIPFTSFNTRCWDGSGVALLPQDVPTIDRIALHVPSANSPVAIDNLCLSGLYLQ